jgi:hypothetical protein
MNLEGLRRITSDGNIIPQVDGFLLLAILDHTHGRIASHLGIAWPSSLSFADGGRDGAVGQLSIVA